MELKPCHDTEGKLSVSKCGVVVGVYGRPLKGGLNKKGGYRYVAFLKGGKRMNRYVHRLVAECWLPNPDNLPEVNHKDGDKSNNHADNLEWCTHAINMSHAFKEGLIWNLPKKGQQVFENSRSRN